MRAMSVYVNGFGGLDITASAVSPGCVETALLAESARIYGLPSGVSFADQQPVHRPPPALEFAPALALRAFQATDAAAGVVVAVDGGLSL